MASKRKVRRKSCEGKIRYDSIPSAMAGMKKTSSCGLNVYKCKFCGKFHVGHICKKAKIGMANGF